MTNKYFGGVVSDKGAAEDVDADLKAVIDNTPKAVDAKMDGLRVADAITEIFNLFKRCNKYIDETMPWALAKDEEKKRSSGNSSLESDPGNHQQGARLLEILHAVYKQKDSGSARRRACDGETGDSFPKDWIWKK